MRIVVTGGSGNVVGTWHGRSNRPTAKRTSTAASTCSLPASKEEVGHLICASSVAAYAPAARYSRVDESWPTTGIPGSTYSAHKVRLEEMIGRYPLPCTVIRPCGIAQASAAQQLRRWLLSRWLSPKLLPLLPIPLWNDLCLQLVHSDDVARAIVQIVRLGAFGAFNLAAEPVLTAPMIADIVGAGRLAVPYPLVEKLAGATARIGLQPLTPEWVRMADQAPLVRTTRAHQDLEWWPEHDARDVLREVIAAMGRRA